MKLSDPLLRGEVALVGAGPGDTGLLTLAGAGLLRNCDAVVFDALVSDDILALVDPGAERIPAGKRGGRPSAEQKDICDTLIRLAEDGKRVVRLKGGDPFVFGRGGEEVSALAEAGIRFRVVPGITSGIAAPAMAGIPLTDRAVNSTLAFITGHEASDESRIDWQALVAAFPVLVIYMGTKNLAGIASRLLAAGMDENTPVAILHAVCGLEEKQDFGSLGEAAAGHLTGESPAIVLIGDVVGRRRPWKDG
ncbi:MAG TPA: uroporphyrinogen-III C-methyltransferase [Mariprofundaceae bacterium]|nr:uroporphyrinogen-III C-methyltransferase [Mariprofundaceae bacterium]